MTESLKFMWKITFQNKIFLVRNLLMDESSVTFIFSWRKRHIYLCIISIYFHYSIYQFSLFSVIFGSANLPAMSVTTKKHILEMRYLLMNK